MGKRPDGCFALRLATVAALGFLALTAGGCSTSSPGAGDAGSDAPFRGSDSGLPPDANLPPGAKTGIVTGVPASCVGQTYRAVAASDCKFITCTGATVYALCTSGVFGACDCSVPQGYTLSK